jgi:hypothetical protein
MNYLLRFSLITVLATLLASPPARAESVRETAAQVQQLAEPASRLELRFDFGAISALDGGSGRADVRVEFATRPDFWYGLGVSSLMRTSTTTSVTSSSTTGTVVTTSMTTNEALLISARVFKRFGPLVLSAGLVDNHGGVGAELRGFADRLRLEALLAQWNPNDPRGRPTLRIGASAQWWRLYAQMGALDVLEAQRSPLAANLYFGAGLRWTDADFLQALWWLRR